MTRNASNTSSPDATKVNAAAVAWLSEGRAVAQATVIETWGSAPVPVGGRMVIASETDFQGSVSGGCVEADVIVAAMDVLADGKPQTLHFGIADETAWRAGLPCGCKIQVDVRRLGDRDAREISQTFDDVRRDRNPRVVATRLADGVQRIYVSNTDAPPEIAAALTSGLSSVVNGEYGETFLLVVKPALRIVIVGATHVAQILNQMAEAAGYDVVVIDPRSAFASASRFDPTTAIIGWPETELKNYANDPFTAVVTLTHVGRIDDETLKIAMRAPCCYVGALGSRKTHADRISRLKEASFTDAEIGRIRAPIGLNIGGKSPGEIAISILAEVVAAFHGKLAT